MISIMNPSHKPRADIRLKVLKAASKSAHRYDHLRALSQALTLAILILVPTLGIARVDFWRGNHFVLGHASALKPAIAAVVVGIASLYVVTFLLNIVAARVFCGWGCPVGQVSRFGEAVDTPNLPRMRKLALYAQGALFSAAMVTSVLAWWIDLRMLIDGSPRELAIGWGLLAFGTLGAFIHGRWWSWEFCKSACPIGVYYSFVSPAKHFGIHFRNAKEECIECNACDNVCPVNLAPRDLMEPIESRSGVCIEGAPGRNHCLECGDCVKACEHMTTLRPAFDGAGAPLKLGWFTGPQRQMPAETPAAETPTAEETKTQ